MAPKVTIIGGGSSSFVPVLIRRLMQSEALEAARVSLMDIDEGRLGVMQALADKLIASEGSDIRVTSTLDQRESLVGADFVIAAIAEGGMDAWANDLEIPGRYGVVMHVGDSIGPGGIMRAFRNAPALAQVARNCAEVAPDAWIFNYTNPAPIEALAMRTAAPRVKSYGLCSCAAHASSREWLARQAGVKPDEIAMPPVVAGINHCASIQALRLIDGRDAMPLVRERATEPVVKWALETYGVLPYCWTHWTEFFPQMQRLEAPYSGTAQGVKMRYGITTHDMAYERARVEGLEALARQWTAPGAAPVTLADLPVGDEDEGIEVIDLIEAIVGNGNITLVVNAPNHGAIPNLPDEAIVEVNAQINAYGVRPIHAGPLAEALAAHLRHYVNFQQHVVKAALSGDRTDALHVFLLDPTLQSRLDLDQTQALLDELLEANRPYLPLFERSH
jgi:alpha-galactosidase/6-phospho-beta-glucosidase family protein